MTGQDAAGRAPPYRLFRRCGLPTQASLPACTMPTRLQSASTWAARQRGAVRVLSRQPLLRSLTQNLMVHVHGDT